MTKTYNERLADNLRLLVNRMHGDVIDLAKWISSTLLVSNGAALVILFNAVTSRAICNSPLLPLVALSFAAGAAFAFLPAVRAYFLGQRSLAALNERADLVAVCLDPTATDEHKAAAERGDKVQIAELRRIARKGGTIVAMYALSALFLLIGFLVPLTHYSVFFESCIASVTP